MKRHHAVFLAVLAGSAIAVSVAEPPKKSAPSPARFAKPIEPGAVIPRGITPNVAVMSAADPTPHVATPEEQACIARLIQIQLDDLPAKPPAP